MKLESLFERNLFQNFILRSARIVFLKKEETEAYPNEPDPDTPDRALGVFATIEISSEQISGAVIPGTRISRLNVYRAQL